MDLVSDLTSTFEGATSFTGESIGSWNVGRVESFEQTFLGAASFVGSSDMEGWDFSSATNMHSMLFNATSFDLNVNGWNVAGVPSINSIFKNANSFSQKVCWESGLHPRAMCYQCFCNTNGAGFDVDPTACSAPPVHPSIKAYSQACEPEDQMKVKQIFDRPEEFVGGTGGTGSFSYSGPSVPEEEGQAAAGLSSGNENTVTTGARQDASAASHSWGNTIGTYHTALAVVGLVVRFF